MPNFKVDYENKLKANRGRTMITDVEADRLFNLIRIKNDSNSLNESYFTYDHENKRIISYEFENLYLGKKLSLDIKDRLLFKANRNVAFEPHLQAYIVQNITERCERIKRRYK